MVETIDIVDLFNRNAALKKMSFLHRTLEIEKLGLQLTGIHHDSVPAIPAVNADSIVDLRSALLILVSAIPTNEFQFDVHIVSEKKRCANIITFFPISDQLGIKELRPLHFVSCL